MASESGSAFAKGAASAKLKLETARRARSDAGMEIGNFFYSEGCDSVAALATAILERATSLEAAKTACREAMAAMDDAPSSPAEPQPTSRLVSPTVFSSRDDEPGSRNEETLPMPRAWSTAACPDTSWPETVECYLGPTNSGKTWQSLEFLAGRGAGCYAGPLRALAWEVREDLVARCARKWPGEAPPAVGLWTGEEALDADEASILSCTAEVAPAAGDTLVLDEVHWCVEPTRGQAWTRLLLAARAGNFKHVRVCGPTEATALMRTVFDAARALEIVPTLRRSRLEFNGDAADAADNLAAFLQRICHEDKRIVAIVAFSRSAVLSLAGAAQAAGLRASAIFGKLPPEARRKQLDEARSGNLDVIVTTDVIGHGINLPIDHVVFAETRKFDGERRRDLAVWEIAQIAGRAGRGSTPGHAWVMAQYGADYDLVRKAVVLANGDDDDDEDEEDCRADGNATPPRDEDDDDGDDDDDDDEDDDGDGDGDDDPPQIEDAEDEEEDPPQLKEPQRETASMPGGKKKKKKKGHKKTPPTTNRAAAVETAEKKNGHDERGDANAKKGQRLLVDHCVLSPDLSTLRALCPNGELALALLPNALRQWLDELAARRPAVDDDRDNAAGIPNLDALELPSWVRGCDLSELCDRLEMLAFDKTLVPKDVRRALTCLDYWALARLPVREAHFGEIAKSVALGLPVRPTKDLDTLEGEDLEDEVQRLGDIVMSARRFPAILARDDDDDDDAPPGLADDSGRSLQRAEALYLDGSKRIGAHVQSCIEAAFLCRNCGKPKHAENKPSDVLCRKCYSALQREKRTQQRHHHQQAQAQVQATHPPPHGRHPGGVQQHPPYVASPAPQFYHTGPAGAAIHHPPHYLDHQPVYYDHDYGSPQYLAHPSSAMPSPTAGPQKPQTPKSAGHASAKKQQPAAAYAASPVPPQAYAASPRGYYHHPVYHHHHPGNMSHAPMPPHPAYAQPLRASPPRNANASPGNGHYGSPYSGNSRGRGSRGTPRGRGKGRRGAGRGNHHGTPVATTGPPAA